MEAQATPAAAKPLAENDIWGDSWLAKILDAIGDIEGDPIAVELRAEHGHFVEVVIRDEVGRRDRRILPILGTVWISGVMGLPRGVQMVKLEIQKEMFVIAHCRYAPIDVTADSVVAALKESRKSQGWITPSP